jgi:hypothetical protein
MKSKSKADSEKLYCVYVAIGHKCSIVAQLVQIVLKEDALEYSPWLIVSKEDALEYSSWFIVSMNKFSQVDCLPFFYIEICNQPRNSRIELELAYQYANQIVSSNFKFFEPIRSNLVTMVYSSATIFFEHLIITY